MLLSDKPKFYGRRQGRKIRKAKSCLLDSFLPEIKIDQTADISKNMFGCEVKEVFLEIGFGNGEHLAGQALNNPTTGFIGAEVFKNGIANLLSLITGIKENADIPESSISLSAARTDNIRVWSDDVRLLFEKIPDNFLSRVYLLFPDPWPKKRHASRRFINPDNLKEIARILKKGGILRVATDHKVYKSWTLHQLGHHPDFRWTAKCGNDWKYPPQDWVETKYQRKAIFEGRKPVFFDFERI
ncbi:MAG: tRNA (guanine(46)-N(7))-methyltransferase TrmB [Alphaproteobacteria bacterium]|nr:tRNA (guanine(46)-N(7))-methyltransferase TrmB [Alphaproteobacteria bacterium]